MQNVATSRNTKCFTPCLTLLNMEWRTDFNLSTFDSKLKYWINLKVQKYQSYMIGKIISASFALHLFYVCLSPLSMFIQRHPEGTCISTNWALVGLCPQKRMQHIQKMQYTHKWYWQYGDVMGQEVSRHVSSETMAEIWQTSWQTKSASLQCVTVAAARWQICTFKSIPFIHFF